MRLCWHARCSGLATFSTARSCSTTARFSHGRNSLAARPPPGTPALTHAALASSIISESSYGRNSGWVTISATSRMTPPLSAALLRSRAPRITLICSGRLLERVTCNASRVTCHVSAPGDAVCGGEDDDGAAGEQHGAAAVPAEVRPQDPHLAQQHQWQWHLVLQKVPSEFYPKVCNHGEGPY